MRAFISIPNKYFDMSRPGGDVIRVNPSELPLSVRATNLRKVTWVNDDKWHEGVWSA